MAIDPSQITKLYTIPLSRNVDEERQSIGKKVASWNWTPIQTNTFYYDDFKGDRKATFQEYLTKYGLKDAEEKAELLSHMTGDTAFKKVAEWTDPSVAVFLQTKKFMKPALEKFGMSPEMRFRAAESVYGMGKIRGITELQEKAYERAYNDFSKKPILDFQKFVRKNTKFIEITYDDMGMENAFFMGLIQSLPVVRKMVKFEGMGMDKMAEEKGLQITQGWGAFMGTMLQFALLGKTMSPFITDLMGMIGGWIGKSSLAGKGMMGIFDMGSKIAQMTTRSISGALSLGSLAAFQVALDNAAEGTLLTDTQVNRILQSIELGGAMGLISGAWFGSPAPWIFKKPMQMLETTALYALENMRTKYQETGEIDFTDFQYSFLHMSTQVPMMELIPILFGFMMGTPWDFLAGNMGGKQTLERMGLELQARILRELKPTLTMKEIKSQVVMNLAKEAPTDIMGLRAWVNRLRTKAAGMGLLRSGKTGPQTIKYKGKTILNPQNKYSRALMSNKDIREILFMYNRVLREHGVDPNASENSLRKFMHWSPKKVSDMLKGTLTEKDAAANMKRLLDIIQTARMKGMRFADKKEILALEKDILKRGVISKKFAKAHKITMVHKSPKQWNKERLRQVLNITKEEAKEVLALPPPKGKIGGRIRVVDSDGKLVGLADADLFIRRYIEEWSEAAFGNKVPLEKFYKHEIDAIRDNLEMRTVGYDTYLALEADIEPMEVNARVFDAIKGWPFFMESQRVLDNYFEIRDARNEVVKWQNLINKDISNIFKKIGGKQHWNEGWRLGHNETFMKIMRRGHMKNWSTEATLKMLNRLGIRVQDKEGFRKAFNEYHAWATSDRSSPYYKNNDWNVNFTDASGQKIVGLRDFFDVPYDLGFERYEPLVLYVGSDRFYETGGGDFKNVHHLVRNTDINKILFSTWMKDKTTGWRGLGTYVNRNLTDKFMSGPLNRLQRQITARNISPRNKAMILRWTAQLKGKPNDLDISVDTWVKDTFSLMPLWIRQRITHTDSGKLESIHINRAMEIGLSCIYAGGLGLKFSGALKNSLQGPLNNPPGISFPYYLSGLRDIFSSKEKRNLLWENGIFRNLGVAGLYREVTDPITNILQKSLFMFTAVDHYWNRGPWYLAARNQVDDYINRFGILEGIKRIGQKQSLGMRTRMIGLAEQAVSAGILAKQSKNNAIRMKWEQQQEATLERIRDEYGFIQQANSNWEYGRLGRPAVFGSETARLLGTFMTWPTWYYGTYLPSLIRYDKKWGLWEHLAKQMIAVTLFSKVLDMNVLPWTGPASLPMVPYGPTVQTFFKAAEYFKALEYGTEEWKTEVLQDLKMNAKVAIPGYYGITDILRAMDELKQETPYFDKRTGILHRDNNAWKTWSDLAGISKWYDRQQEYLQLLKDQAYTEARKYETKYHIQKLSRTPQGIRVVGD